MLAVFVIVSIQALTLPLLSATRLCQMVDIMTWTFVSYQSTFASLITKIMLHCVGILPLRNTLLTLTLTLTACSATFDPDTIASRLRELAFLNNAATIRFKAAKPATKRRAGAAKTNGSKAATSSDEDSSDEDSDSDEGVAGDPKEGWQVFHYSEGLKEYVKWVNSDRQAFHEPIVISREVKRTPTSGHANCT